MLQLLFAARLGRRKSWLAAGLLGLLLGNPWLTHGQTSTPPPIAVRVTPTTANICDGSTQSLTAQAMYPPFTVGSGFDQKVRTIVVQSDGKVLVGGDFTMYNGQPRLRVARLNADGSIDPTFNADGSGVNANVVGLAVQPADGKILVGGDFTNYSNATTASTSPRNYMARLNADGTLDTSFKPASGSGFASATNTFAIQPDGKVLVGGAFALYNNSSTSTTPLKFIARLDGTTAAPDPNFASTTGSGFDGAVNALALQTTSNPATNNRILVGGDFTHYYSATTPGTTTACSYVARLNPDGTLDTSFKPTTGTGLNGRVLAMARQSDGRVLVGGDFTSYADNSTTTPRSYVARLNPDGTLDTDFKPLNGTGFDGRVRALALQPDGKVLVGGDFTHYSGNGTNTACNYVARLNSDGTLDTSFAAAGGAGLSDYVFAVVPHLDGKVLAGGDFLAYNATARRHIARLTNTGALNDTETPVAGATYSWASVPGSTPSLPALPTIQVSAAGTYTVTATLNGATAIASSVVTVTPKTTLSSPTQTGAVGDAVQITGTGLAGATAVSFNGVPASFSFNTATGILTATVPFGATSGPLTVTIPPCVITVSTLFNIRLIVSTPMIATSIAPGTYTSITVLNSGVGVLSGNVTVTDSVVVSDGGVLQLGPYRLLGSNGGFRLAKGGTLSLGYAKGLSVSTSSTDTTGAVRMNSRRYSDDASYIYTGTTSQETGPGLPSRVRNLTDNTQNGGQLKLTAPTKVAQVLTIASSTDFNLNGNNLTLLSDATGTALVVNGLQGGKVLGTATMERYIDPTYNTGTGYRYYSPPVSGAAISSLATLNFTPVVNAAYNTAAVPTMVTPFPNVFQFDQARLSNATIPALPALDKGLLSPGSVADVLVAGTGYALNIPATEKINFTGTLTTGTQTRTNLTRGTGSTASGNGWNLVGNPYPAPINWDLVDVSDRPNLDAALYTYESTGPDAGIYFSYVHGVGSSPIVAAGKSFFVRASSTNSPGSLTLRNSHRLTDYTIPAGFARSQIARAEVDLELSYDGGKKNRRPPTCVYTDATAAAHRQALSTFDSSLDAYRIPATTGLNLSINPDPNSTIPQAEELAIKALSAFSAGQEVPLTVRVPPANISRTYELYASTIQNIPSGLVAYLDDRVLNTSTNLSVQPSYSFTVTTATTAKRFFLRFGPPIPLATHAWAASGSIALYPNPAHDHTTVQVPGLLQTTELEATLLNSLGQVVQQQRAALPAAGARLSLDVQGLAAGVYVVRLRANDAVAIRRLVIE